jgi:hypothetical protein
MFRARGRAKVHRQGARLHQLAAAMAERTTEAEDDLPMALVSAGRPALCTRGRLSVVCCPAPARAAAPPSLPTMTALPACQLLGWLSTLLHPAPPPLRLLPLQDRDSSAVTVSSDSSTTSALGWCHYCPPNHQVHLSKTASSFASCRQLPVQLSMAEFGPGWPLQLSACPMCWQPGVRTCASQLPALPACLPVPCLRAGNGARRQGGRATLLPVGRQRRGVGPAAAAAARRPAAAQRT